MRAERPVVGGEAALAERIAYPFTQLGQGLDVTFDAGPGGRAEAAPAGQPQRHRFGSWHVAHDRGDRPDPVAGHVTEEHQGEMPLVDRGEACADGQRASQGAQLGRRREDRDEQPAQDDSRAAGPPPNSTSSQLGSRLRGLASSVSAGC